MRATLSRPTPADRVDLTVDSSPIDLGTGAGFHHGADRRQGTLEAHVRVTGRGRRPASRPAPCSIANGGVHGRPDRRHLLEYRRARSTCSRTACTSISITVLDNHQSSLSITGDLARPRAARSAASRSGVNADDFKVIDNKMGNVRVQSDLALSGELRSPIVAGDSRGHDRRGQSRRDHRASRRVSAYATEPTSSTTPATDCRDRAGRSGAGVLEPVRRAADERAT